MSSVDENALMILRFLKENNHVLSSEIKVSILLERMRLCEKDFDTAITYLSQSGHIDSYGAARKGALWMTVQGINHLNNVMESRSPLSLGAERVLRYVASKEPPGGYTHSHVGVKKDDIVAAFQLEQDALCRIFQELEDEAFIKPVQALDDRHEYVKMWWSVKISENGRRALRRNLKIQQSPVSHIETHFHGDVNSSNIALGVQNYIQQNISTDPEEIRQQINETLNQLVNTVSSLLELEQKQDLLTHIKEIQEEIRKPQPDKGKIHRLMGIISFGGNVEGGLSLGERLFPGQLDLNH
jgi:hypothetical protein